MPALSRKKVANHRSLPQTFDEFVELSRDGFATAYRPASKRQLSVLVVDDDRDTSDSLSMLVTMWGHNAWVAHDGATALKVASAYPVDVMLLDIAMPEMNGCSVARQLRRQPRYKDTLLIAISGWADEEHRLLGESAGFDLYLMKPVELSDLEVLLALERVRLAASPEAMHVAPQYNSRLPDQPAFAAKGRNQTAQAQRRCWPG
jgi:DNA-binding response OmpR family regulator